MKDNSIENNEKDFFNNLKINPKDVNLVIQRKKFLEEIDGNVEALNMLSDDRLIKLIAYYDSIIEEYEKKIKKLKENND